MLLLRTTFAVVLFMTLPLLGCGYIQQKGDGSANQGGASDEGASGTNAQEAVEFEPTPEPPAEYLIPNAKKLKPVPGADRIR